MRRITIKDIAEKAGVSYSTVSRALRKTGQISEPTRQHILEICKQEGYVVNTLARGLSSRHSHLLGLIIPDISNPFYSEIVHTIEQYARQEGYIVIPCSSMNQHDMAEELVRILISQQVDGIIFAGSGLHAFQIIQKYQEEIPMVLLGGSQQSPKDSLCNMVSINNYAGGQLAAKHLLALGHRSFCFAGFRQSSVTHQHRLAGFTDTLAEKGLEPRVFINTDSHSSIESGLQIGSLIFSAASHPTAIFAASDTVALGVLQAADQEGIAIPRDYSLVGFDNIAYSALPKIELTTIDHCKEEIAQTSCQLLLEQISAAGKDQKALYQQRLFQPSLITRKSCRPLASR